MGRDRLLKRALDALVSLDLGISPFRLRTAPFDALTRGGKLLAIPTPSEWTTPNLRRFVTRLEREIT